MQTPHRFQGKGRHKVVRSAAVAVISLILMNTALQAEVLTLDRAIDTAMENSPEIIRARNNLEISEQNLKAQNASLKSQLSLDVTPFAYSRQLAYQTGLGWFWARTKSSSALLRIDQRIKWTDALLSLSNDLSWDERSTSIPMDSTVHKYENTLWLSLSQKLFTYNRTQQEIKRLELAREEARLSYAIRKLSIEQRVMRGFYDVYRSRMSLEIAREEFKNKEESYNIIKNRVEAGISAREELFQAEVNFASSKATLQNGQVAYEDALDNFKILLGLPIHDELEISADVRKFVVETDLDLAIEKGLTYRMELRQADIAIENAKYDLIETGAEDEFYATLGLSYGLTGSDEHFSDIYDETQRREGFSIDLSIPIWDWGRKKSRMKAAELRVDNQMLSRQDMENEVILNIRQAYRALQNQLIQIEIKEKSVENARLTYEINLERYRNGDISSKDIGEYQNQLSQAQLDHIGALIDYKLALLNLKIASLWDFENDRPVLDIE